MNSTCDATEKQRTKKSEVNLWIKKENGSNSMLWYQMMQIKLHSTIKIEEMRRNPQLGINPKVERQICLNSIIKMIKAKTNYNRPWTIYL